MKIYTDIKILTDVAKNKRGVPALRSDCAGGCAKPYRDTESPSAVHFEFTR